MENVLLDVMEEIKTKAEQLKMVYSNNEEDKYYIVRNNKTVEPNFIRNLKNIIEQCAIVEKGLEGSLLIKISESKTSKERMLYGIDLVESNSDSIVFSTELEVVDYIIDTCKKLKGVDIDFWEISDFELKEPRCDLYLLAKIITNAGFTASVGHYENYNSLDIRIK